MERKDFYRLLKAVPKAELHLHAEAVIRPATIAELYKKSTGRLMPQTELDKLFSYFDLPGFLESFLYIQTLYTSAQDLEFMFRDFSDYLEENNIVYAETFFSPTMHIRKGRTYKDMINVIQNSVNNLDQHGRIVKVLIDVSRSFGLDNAMNNLEYMLQNPVPCVIGIGLGGDEQKGKAEEFETVYKRAKDHGFHRVAHAGEVCDSSSIKNTIQILGAERIGHGITAAYDKDLTDYLSITKVPLEVCPTSNIFTRKYVTELEKHPVKQLYDAGVFVTINTDDPVFFKVSLIDEYWNLYDKLGFTLEDIKILILNSFKAAFITEAQKAAYCAQVNEAWNTWITANSSLL